MSEKIENKVDVSFEFESGKRGMSHGFGRIMNADSEYVTATERGYSILFFPGKKVIVCLGKSRVLIVCSETYEELKVIRCTIEPADSYVRHYTEISKFTEQMLLVSRKDGIIEVYDMTSYEKLKEMDYGHDRIDALMSFTDKDVICDDEYRKCYFVNNTNGHSSIVKFDSNEEWKRFPHELSFNSLAKYRGSKKIRNCLYLNTFPKEIVDLSQSPDHVVSSKAPGHPKDGAIHRYNLDTLNIDVVFGKPSNVDYIAENVGENHKNFDFDYDFNPRVLGMVTYLNHLMPGTPEIVVCTDFRTKHTIFYDGESGQVHFSFRNHPQPRVYTANYAFLDQYLFLGGRHGRLECLDLRKLGEKYLVKDPFSKKRIPRAEIDEKYTVVVKKICTGFITGIEMIEVTWQEKYLKLAVSSTRRLCRVIKVSGLHFYEILGKDDEQKRLDLKERLEYLFEVYPEEEDVFVPKSCIHLSIGGEICFENMFKVLLI